MSDFDDYTDEMNGFGDFGDSWVESVLSGDEPDDHVAVARWIADMRADGNEPLDPEIATNHITMLAETVRLSSSSEDETCSPIGRDTMMTRLRTRVASKVAVASIATLLLGGSVAAAATGNLPQPAQQAFANMGALFGIEMSAAPEDPGGDAPGEANSDAAHSFSESVREAVDEYRSALTEWTDCVSENAASRGDTQNDPETRTEGPFDPTEGCDPKPILDIPEPDMPAETGPPETVPGDTAPPDTVPPTTGPPDTVPPTTGPPDTVPPTTGPPDTVPPTTGPPDTVPPTTGPPDTVPGDTGPPDTVPGDTGPPDTVPGDTAPDAGPPVEPPDGGGGSDGRP
ncbi:MAG: hypothetical protein GEU79_15285 [Acidimicrobiia bacterium]|nr:hypothetical protein [Acidimicrobiia bacterium]